MYPVIDALLRTLYYTPTVLHTHYAMHTMAWALCRGHYAICTMLFALSYACTLCYAHYAMHIILTVYCEGVPPTHPFNLFGTRISRIFLIANAAEKVRAVFCPVSI